MNYNFKFIIFSILGILISVIGIGFFGTMCILSWAFANYSLMILSIIITIIAIISFILIFYIIKFEMEEKYGN